MTSLLSLALHPTMLHTLTPHAIPLVSTFLKQTVERIAKLRATAARHLHHLLTHWPSSITTTLPMHTTLHNALVTQSPETMATMQGLPAVALLLQADAYRTALTQGLVASMGGVEQQLARAAAAAVHAACDATPGLWWVVLQALVGCWEVHARTHRLGGALPRAVELVLAGNVDVWVGSCGEDTSAYSGDGRDDGHDGSDDNHDGKKQQGDVLHDAQGTSVTQHGVTVHHVLSHLVQLCVDEARGCRDVPRVLSCASLLCTLVAAAPVAWAALRGAVGFLVSRFPKVCLCKCLCVCTASTLCTLQWQ